MYHLAAVSKFSALVCIVAIVSILIPPAAHAASGDAAAIYPHKPVRLLMGPAAGGPTDGLGRILASKLSELWGQPVIIENRPGAGNTIATTLAARAMPDGYTLLLCPLSDSIAPAVYKLEYDFLRDIAAVARIGTTANVFVVHPSLPVKSVKEFIAHAMQHPGKLDYGAQGISQAGYLSMELLKSMAGGIDVKYVAYKAASVLTADLLGGRIQAQITNLPSHLPTISTGKLRALGVTTPRRDRRLPDVPAIAETLPGFDVTTWYGVCAPAGVPGRVVSKVSADVTRALNTVEVRRRLEVYGVDPDPSTPEVFAALLRAETAKWAKIVAGLQQDAAVGKTKR
jgi:tripartite-type tricarboxylate transporter receptor subunit TctC